MIAELLKILDKVNIDELGMRQKLKDEIARFNIFQRSVLESTGKTKTATAKVVVFVYNFLSGIRSRFHKNKWLPTPVKNLKESNPESIPGDKNTGFDNGSRSACLFTTLGGDQK